MANIKIGNLEIDNLKVGTLSVDALYIGDVKIYPPTPPTPTYEWVSYQQGDIVPRKTFYGVKLRIDLGDNYYLIFTDSNNNYIEFDYSKNDNDWIAYDYVGNQIDISEYYDESTYTYTIEFSDLGLGGLPLFHPSQDDGVNFEFDLELYEDPTEKVLQWVTFNSGDVIPSDLEIYGVSGLASNLTSTFIVYGDNIEFTDEGRGKCAVHIGWMEYRYCYEETGLSMSSNLEYIFSNISNSCKLDSYTVSNGVTVSGTIQLYIYA